MHVNIHTGATPNGVSSISPSAAELVELGPSPTCPPADRIKALAAALITECEAIRDARQAGAREAAVAITQIQGATMFGVTAARLMHDRLGAGALARRAIDDTLPG